MVYVIDLKELSTEEASAVADFYAKYEGLDPLDMSMESIRKLLAAVRGSLAHIAAENV